MTSVICVVLGYFIGNIQSAYLVGKAMHVDLRKEGSGNLGSTNALRVLGKKAGAITFLGDILKSVVSFILCTVFFPSLCIWGGMLGSFGAILGHDFPFYLQFKGGKGIAAMIGMVLCLAPSMPWVMVVGFGLGILAIAFTKYVSLGSILFSFSIPIMLYIEQASKYMVLLGVVIGGLAIYRHRANIKRLLSGTESKIGKH